MLSATPKAVLFDWDGTLVNSWPIIHESMNQTLKAMGHAEWTIEETNERVRRSLREAFPPLFGNRWKEARDIFYAAYRAVHLERIAKKEGAEELIRVLFGLGVCLGVVSNKSGGHLRAESKILGWDRYFEGRLVGATDARRDKPSTDPIYMALTGSGISPGSDVWFVGDTWVDMACGRAANCHTILIGESVPDDPEFADHPPDEYFLNCLALMEVVRNF
ncbi:MAG: HAD family hydrolase [Alphaproteobacteria bacterium]|nr:HAD family hydrolase [Alphaproteobacteria bacterium]MEC8461838.1 HAD family hydrolase [Pseudomonadota bacterium]